jgi:hypothetical protein
MSKCDIVVRAVGAVDIFVLYMLGYEVEKKRSRLLCGLPNPGLCGGVAKMHINSEIPLICILLH